MKKGLLFFFILLIFLGCERKKELEEIPLDEVYAGTILGKPTFYVGHHDGEVGIIQVRNILPEGYTGEILDVLIIEAGMHFRWCREDSTHLNVGDTVIFRKISVQYFPEPGSALIQKSLPIGTLVGYNPSPSIVQGMDEHGRIFLNPHM